MHRQLSFEMVQGFVIGQAAPSQVYQYIRATQTLEAILRRVGNIHFHYANLCIEPLQMRCIASNGNDINPLSVQGGKNMSPDETACSCNGNFHSVTLFR